MKTTIGNGTVVTIAYRLRSAENGPVMEDVQSQYPFRFLSGVGQLLPAFEAELAGLKAGDSFRFHLTPEQGYGSYLESEVVEVPLEWFTNDQESLNEFLRLGYFLTLTDSQGRQRVGKVLAIGGESVRMDFNHEMAGKHLYFDGEVLEVRAASSEEMALGRPIS